MDLKLLEEVSLEYLSSQVDPVEYDALYSAIQEENGITADDLKLQLWILLYSNRNVLILTNNEFNDHIRASFRAKFNRSCKNIYDIDVSVLDPVGLAEHIGATRLACSNAYRVRSLNLLMYEPVTKSPERFRLLMSIASKRYSGYWQSDLVSDLKISPKDLFSLTNSLCKLGLVCKVTIPQNRIYKYLVNNMSGSFVIKYDTNEDSQDSERDLAPKAQNSASICFFHKYFVIDKIPQQIRTLCFSELTRNCESTMLEILDREENKILLESDWRRAYFNNALEEVRQVNTKIDNHLLSRSYLSFRKSLELRSKIALIFAWCPQTNTFERSIMLLKSPNDHPLRTKSVNTLHVINLKPETPKPESDDDPHCSKTLELNGHSLQEYAYYIIKLAKNGITAKHLNRYLPIKYKQITKLMLHMESIGLIKKETEREGKVFMYRYFASDHKKSLVKSEPVVRDPLNPDPRLQTPTRLGASGEPTCSEPSDSHSSLRSDPEHRNYVEFLAVQKARYLHESDYMRDFEDVFGTFELPKQINTVLFKKRMVLMTNYMEYFRAATFTNIATFYSDMENAPTKADRKTVMRVSEFVLKHLKHLKKMRCEELKGANLSLTILFDSRHYTQSEAYKYVRNNINVRRNLVSMHTASLKTKVNDQLKSLDYVNTMKQDSIEIIETPDTASDLTNLNINVPCLVRNVSVNQQNSEINTQSSLTFSQRILSSNGYIFPVMTRVRLLHLFLVENFSDSAFTTTQVLYAMTLENYFQLVGCGYSLTDAHLHVNDRLEHLPPEHQRILLSKRRDPVNILNNQLNFLYRMKLLLFLTDSESSEAPGADPTLDFEPVNRNVESDVVRSELSWKLVRHVPLYDYAKNELVRTHDIVRDFELYWQNLKAQVDAYVVADDQGPPETMPVKEVFVKKNWKKIIYLNSALKFELDKVVSFWLKLSCNGLHPKSLAKLFYMPFRIVNLLCTNYGLTSAQIHSYILTKIKYVRYDTAAEGDQILDKILSNIYRDTELLWISRYVISEKLINRIFLSVLKRHQFNVPGIDCPNGDLCADIRAHTPTGPFATSGYPQLWSYMSVLFKRKYSPNECKLIFDYIINKSNFNLRVLKKFRKLKTNEIMHYITKKSYTNITNTYNTASTNLSTSHHLKGGQVGLSDRYSQLCNSALLKSALFTCCTRPSQRLEDLLDPKQFKHILKRWCDHGWIVKSKKKTELFNLFKLSNLSKLKLFPKYSNLSFFSNQLAAYIHLYANEYSDGNEGYITNGPMTHYKNHTYTQLDALSGLADISSISDCLDLDYFTVYNLLENLTHVKLEPKWYQSSALGVKSALSTLINGDMSKQAKGASNRVAVSRVKGGVTGLQAHLSDFDFTASLERATVVPKLLLCEHDQTDILNPLQFRHAYSAGFDNMHPRREFVTVTDLVLHLMSMYKLKCDLKRVENLLREVIKTVRDSEQRGVSYSKLMEQFVTNCSTKLERPQVSSVVVAMDVSQLMLKVALITAVMLRLLVMVPDGKEFLYVHWEHGQRMFVSYGFHPAKKELKPPNHLSRSEADRPLLNGVVDHHSFLPNGFGDGSKGGNAEGRPEFIPELVWYLFERRPFEVKGGDLASFVEPLRDLFPKSLDSYTHPLNGAFYSPFVTLEGDLNTHIVAFVSLRVFFIVKEKPGITAEQIWKDLVILDECEVELLLESLLMSNILRGKELDVGANCIFRLSSSPRGAVGFRLYYPQETSYVLWRFKNILFTR